MGQGQAADLSQESESGHESRCQADTGDGGSKAFRAHAARNHSTVKQAFCAKKYPWGNAEATGRMNLGSSHLSFHFKSQEIIQGLMH